MPKNLNTPQRSNCYVRLKNGTTWPKPRPLSERITALEARVLELENKGKVEDTHHITECRICVHASNCEFCDYSATYCARPGE